MRDLLVRRVRPRVLGAVAAAGILATGLVTTSVVPVQAATVTTQTFSYTGSTASFVVPAGVATLTVTMRGGQGGRGGHDSQGAPTPGGYVGLVTGTIDVTPGDTITVAVGGGGGTGQSSAGSAAGGSAGLNPLTGYDGAVGGVAGPAGGSGGGGGSGAASVLRIGATDIVAAGAGGNGGSGQYTPIVGRRAEETHTSRSDATSTTGRPGLNTALACSVGFNCDGGASGAGGGGAQGGERGAVQFGGASYTEYFGFGGYPGSNATAGLTGLTAGYEYYAANNANGSITISYDDGTPGTPLDLAATAGTAAASLTWSAPASSGNSAITDYRVEYATNAGGPFTIFTDGVSTVRAAQVTGLTNGTTYYFRVTAINTEGLGTSATTSIGLVPSDVPSAPTVTGLVAFGNGIHVDFTPGATDSPITGYEYLLDGGTWVAATAVSNRLSITGLANGAARSVQIRARNIIGASVASSPAQSATPVDAPLEPTSLQLVAGNGSLAATWTAPTVDNGATITDYVVQTATNVGGPYTTFADGTSTATSATVTGLTNGTPYFVRVAAVNSVGSGAWSRTTSGTPLTSPAAPSVSLTPADGALSVAITPGSNGGSAITLYEYRLNSGTWQSTGISATTFVIDGLTNGTAYDVQVRATNAAGTGPASTTVSGTPRSVPAAPSIATIALDTGAVDVAFSLGASGGSAITNVEYSIDGGTNWIPRSPASTTSPLTITGLTGGQTYPVVLRAVNAAGNSLASNSSSVTARGVPSAPTITVTPADRSLRVSFDAPLNGGSPITNYEFSTNNGSSWTTLSPASVATPIVIESLTNGTPYQVKVRAVNAAGTSVASAAVAGTPRTTPSAPAIVGGTASGSDGTLDVAFTDPTDDGGASITTYQYSTDAGATWRTRATGTTASPLTITTLSTNGTTALTGGTVYPVEIRAVNAAGPGAASAVASGITTTVPDAPTITSTTPIDGSATVQFTRPANGGAEIIRYEYRIGSGSWTDTGTLADSFVITGLTNGSADTLQLRAVNSVGNSAAASTWLEVYATPGEVDLTAVTPGDATLVAAFASSTLDHGSAITTYQYSTDGGTTWRTRTTGTNGSPITITTVSAPGAAALVNGTVYSVQVRAVNAAGSGAASNTRLAAPRGTPAAPTSVVITPGNSELGVAFTLPSDGGSPITRIEYRLGSGSWVDAGALASPFTITGLTNGTPYSVSVRAVNAIGNGGASTAVSGTPRTTPDSPTAVSAAGGPGAALINWTAPSYTGGGGFDGSTARVFAAASGGSPIASCGPALVTTCTITGLTNGTTVYVDVVSSNEAGNSAPSAPRVAVTPIDAPHVSIASITPSATGLSVAVTVTDDGGSPISAYEYQLDTGAWVAAPTATSPISITGLTRGTTYAVRIRAISAGGTGNASAPMNAVPHTVPDAPTALVANSAPASVVLSWVAPADSGGQPVTDYTVQYATNANGPFTTFADGTSTATSATVTGLTDATAYFFRVAAVNTAGAGGWSALGGATPRSAPTAPTITSLTPGSQFLQVAFTTPSSTGGAAITGYEYRLNGTGTWRSLSGTTSPLTIAGLTNGTQYGVQLRAVNSVGGGTASNSLNGTPYGLPGAVVGFRATPGASSVTLSWDAANANGSPITSYNVVRWSAATEGSIAASATPTGTSHTFTGLGNGTYYFTIEATNAAGTGPRSTPRTSATVGATLPAAPTMGTVTVDGTQASLAWTAGEAGTSAVSNWLVQYSTDDTTWTTMATGSVTPSAAFALPSASTPYALRVAGISASGAGSFATLRPPVVGSGSLSGIGTTSATVTASANGNDAGTVGVAFEYATSVGALGTGSAVMVAATPATLTGNGATSTSAVMSPLQANTGYVVRTVATVGSTTVRSATTAFTTLQPQTVSFTSTAPSPALVGNTYTPTATATSGLTAAITVTQGSPSVCWLVSGQITFIAPGTCRIAASQAGNGSYAAAASVEQVLTVEVPATAAGLVGDIRAVDEDGRFSVEWATPTDNGGSPVTGYQVTTDFGQTCTSPTTFTVNGDGRTWHRCVFGDLTNGSSLQVSVAAVNGVGVGAAATTTGRPFGVPSAPTVTITGGNGSLELNWTAAAANGRAVTAYRIYVDGVLHTTAGAATRSATITGLAAGQRVTIGVEAVNVAGAGVRGTATGSTSPPELQLTLDLDAGEPVADAPVVVAGSGLKPFSLVRIELHSDPVLLGTVTTDATGAFSTTVLLPKEVPAGSHNVVATGIAPDDTIITERAPIFIDWTGAVGFTGTPTSNGATGGNSPTLGGYVPVQPIRVLDTREGAGTKVAAGTTYRLSIGADQLPAGTSAVVLNLAVVDADTAGFITVHPCSASRPWASALNYAAGEVSANLVTASYRPGQELCIYTMSTTHLVVDLNGAHVAAGTRRLTSQDAVRLLDTRASTPVEAGGTLTIPVTGDGRAPSDATAAMLYVAVDRPADAGFLTVYPCGAAQPLASNLNFVAGQTVGNGVIAKIGDDGAVCVYSSAATDVVVDFTGAATAAGSTTFHALVSGRVLDTREGGVAPGAGDVVRLDFTSLAAGTSVDMNLAVVDPQHGGFVTAYPCGTERPLAASLNYRRRQTKGNHLTVAIGAEKAVCLYTMSATHLVVDVDGVHVPTAT